MIHEIKVKEIYYNKIKACEKIYEVRLLDEKRKQIKVGDTLRINKEPLMEEFLDGEVVDLVMFKSFDEMANSLPAKEIGFNGCNEKQIVDEYHKFYSKEVEQKYGVVAIKLKVKENKYQKYYNLIKEQSVIYDKTQNCNLGQTWRFHLLPVIKNATYLADKYGADKDIVEVSAIFHDYADLLDFANRDNHHILGAELAEGILKQDDVSQDFIDKVKLCIINHRASIVKDKFSLEEICVADADALSHLDSVVELICWRAYLGEDIISCNNFVKNKITKSYAKMSEQTKELTKDKYESIIKILM